MTQTPPRRRPRPRHRTRRSAVRKTAPAPRPARRLEHAHEPHGHPRATRADHQAHSRQPHAGALAARQARRGHRQRRWLSWHSACDRRARRAFRPGRIDRQEVPLPRTRPRHARADQRRGRTGAGRGLSACGALRHGDRTCGRPACGPGQERGRTRGWRRAPAGDEGPLSHRRAGQRLQRLEGRGRAQAARARPGRGTAPRRTRPFPRKGPALDGEGRGEGLPRPPPVSLTVQ